jgi:hypothetical protein
MKLFILICSVAMIGVASVLVAAGTPTVLLDSELHLISAGDNCQTATPISSGCTNCVKHLLDDVWFKCDTEQQGSACMGYFGLGNPTCETITPSCGGLATGYPSLDNCQMNMNGGTPQACGRHYSHANQGVGTGDCN